MTRTKSMTLRKMAKTVEKHSRVNGAPSKSHYVCPWPPRATGPTHHRPQREHLCSKTSQKALPSPTTSIKLRTQSRRERPRKSHRRVTDPELQQMLPARVKCAKRRGRAVENSSCAPCRTRLRRAVALRTRTQRPKRARLPRSTRLIWSALTQRKNKSNQRISNPSQLLLPSRLSNSSRNKTGKALKVRRTTEHLASKHKIRGFRQKIELLQSRSKKARFNTDFSI